MRSGIECQTGSLCDGGFSVEGVSATAPGQTVRIAYEIVDDGGEDEEVVATVDRTVAVRPAASVSLSKTFVTKLVQDGYIELVFCVNPNDFSINSCGGVHVPIQN